MFSGGATALLAVIGSNRVKNIGYIYVLFPCIIASALQVTIGIIWNNLSKVEKRSYPILWFPFSIHNPAQLERNQSPTNNEHVEIPNTDIK